jgi:anti-sigma regulatory factor (Ser/Thr protein kinase)
VLGDAERRAYMRFEAAANVAYRRFAASVLCPYDAGGLPDAVLEDALRTHPQILTRDGPRATEAFVDPRAFIRLRSRIQAPPQGAPAFAINDADDLAPARNWVSARAAAAGLAAERIEDLEVAVSEAATNALVHGTPPRCVWVYERERLLICHVHDGGPGLADPLAGYLPPELDREGGRGLWLIRQICDVVEAAHDETGSHTYLGLRL